MHIALHTKKQRRQRPTGPLEGNGAATLPSLKSLSGSRLIIHDCLNRIVSKDNEMYHIRHPKPDSSLFDNIPIKPHLLPNNTNKTSDQADNISTIASGI
ncbi:hypothetical protein [Aeromonas sobria]|uniref:hypothetical protein n=1 Tax=Aeromonas sobria TaxID=646 RepID=UPI0012FEA975|nr:hypothetical protein [Aeromonas sobria]